MLPFGVRHPVRSPGNLGGNRSAEAVGKNNVRVVALALVLLLF